MGAEAVNAASVALKKVPIERALGAELSHQLGYVPGAAKSDSSTNPYNSKSRQPSVSNSATVRSVFRRLANGEWRMGFVTPYREPTQIKQRISMS